MTDIVKRLRRGVDTNEPPDKTDAIIMGEAADEIKRLLAALKEVKEAWYGRCAVIAERDAEIERLRDELANKEEQVQRLKRDRMWKP